MALMKPADKKNPPCSGTRVVRGSSPAGIVCYADVAVIVVNNSRPGYRGPINSFTYKEFNEEGYRLA